VVNLLKPLRCGIIGCGRVGCGFDDKKRKEIMTHAGAYTVNPYTNLVAFCDIDKKKLEKYGKKFSVKGLYTKSLEMFQNENLDCVSICTLVDSHLTLVKQAVKYNIKGIFLEKPISYDLATAKKIIDICKKSRTVLIIDHKRRFDPVYHHLRKLIRTKLSKIQLINVYYGAGITNTCSHVFDILRFLFDEVNYVKGRFSKNLSLNKLDPNIDVEIGFRKGEICMLQSLDLQNYGLLEMDVFGTKGRIKVNLESDEITYYKISSTNVIVYKNLVPTQIKLKKSKSNIQLGIQNLVDCIHFNKIPLCTGNDGLKSLELIIASILSANKEKRIKLPLETKMKIKSL